MRSEIFSIQNMGNTDWLGEDIYLYLCWLTSRHVSGLAISSFPLHYLHILESDLFNMIDFFAPNFFIFSSTFLSQKFQSQLEKSSVIVLRRGEILVTSKEFYKLHQERISENEVPDISDEKICPLRHLLLLSKTLNEKQRNSFELAIKYRFPIFDLIDFSERTIRAHRKEILSKWDLMIRDQKGSLEDDFVRTLRSALNSLEKEYNHMFEKIYSIVPSDYSEYSLSPLFALLPYISMKRSRVVTVQPRIGIKSLRFEAIFELEEELIPDFIALLRGNISSNFLKVTIDEMKRIQLKYEKATDEKYYRVRIFISLESTSGSISLEDSVTLVEELSYLAVEEALNKISVEGKALYETPIGPYERFKNRKNPEFWLKNAEVVIQVPFFMSDITRETIRSDFGSHLDAHRPIRTRRSGDMTEIVFTLNFGLAYDYIIDGQEEGLFPNIEARDAYTKIGVEHLMRKEFNQAFSYLRMAKTGLLRDYLETFGFSESKKREKIELIDKISEYLLLDDILPSEILICPTYTNNSSHQGIFEMITTTEKWVRTAEKLREIDELERQIRLQTLGDEEYANIMSTLRFLLSKIEFRFSKNFQNFIEDIGSFYVDTLQKTEERAPESVKEWMNLSI